MRKMAGGLPFPPWPEFTCCRITRIGPAPFSSVKLEMRPDAPQIHYFQGRLLQATGDLPDAEKAFLKAVELAPQWPDAHAGLAGAYVQQGKLNEAIAKFEESYRRQPSLPIRMQLAMLYDLGGRYDDAIRVYQELLKEANQSPAILNNLAYLYAEHASDRNMLAEGSKLMVQALAQEPENPNLLDTSAWLAYRQGDLDGAWRYVQDAQARSPQSAVHHLHAAEILHARGEKEYGIGIREQGPGASDGPDIQRKGRGAQAGVGRQQMIRQGRQKKKRQGHSRTLPFLFGGVSAVWQSNRGRFS